MTQQTRKLGLLDAITVIDASGPTNERIKHEGHLRQSKGTTGQNSDREITRRCESFECGYTAARRVLLDELNRMTNEC